VLCATPAVASTPGRLPQTSNPGRIAKGIVEISDNLLFQEPFRNRIKYLGILDVLQRKLRHDEDTIGIKLIEPLFLYSDLGEIQTRLLKREVDLHRLSGGNNNTTFLAWQSHHAGKHFIRACRNIVNRKATLVVGSGTK